MTCCKLACASKRAISQENKTGHNNNKYVKRGIYEYFTVKKHCGLGNAGGFHFFFYSAHEIFKKLNI